MNDPILSYDTNTQRLILSFEDWTNQQITAVQQMLLCWAKRGSHLQAWPIKLAKVEVLELFPNTRLDASMLDFETDQAILYDMGQTDAFDPNLFNEQIQPTKLLYLRENAILTAAPGLGKTIMALVALRKRFHTLAVVVAPLSSLDSWAKEAKKWYQPYQENKQLTVDIQVWRKLPNSWQPSTVIDVQMLIMSPQVVKAMADRFDEFFNEADRHDQILILDESFLYKNRKAQRKNAAGDLASYFGIRWLLSGMPVSRFIDDLYAQLNILYPAIFKNYWKFVDRYCMVNHTQWGTSVVADKPGALERIQADFSDILISCEYPENIPGWEPQIINCPMEYAQQAIYTELKEALIVKAATLGSDKPLTLKTLLTLTGRLLQVASNPLLVDGFDDSGKWTKLVDVLQQNELPALVWINYIKTGEVLQERLSKLGYTVALLTGAVKSADRQAIVDAFQAGKIDILIIHPGVGKYSHTLTACKTAIYLERSFDGEAYYQSLYRVRRIVSKHAVKVVYLLSTYQDGKMTIDQVVHKILLERSQKAQKLTIGQLISQI